MSKQPIPARTKRNEMRERAAQQRSQQNRMLMIAGAVVVALLGLVIFINIRNTLPVAGEESFTSQGNIHIDDGKSSPIVYNSTPPSSGPHYGGLANWGIYDTPIRYEQLNHNLEDGGVIVYYQCPEGCADDVAKMTELVQPYLNAGRHLVMLPNDPTFTADGTTPVHKDMEAKIAVVAWGKVLKLDAVDTELMRRFIDKYVGIDHHVAGQG